MLPENWLEQKHILLLTERTVMLPTAVPSAHIHTIHANMFKSNEILVIQKILTHTDAQIYTGKRHNKIKRK